MLQIVRRLFCASNPRISLVQRVLASSGAKTTQPEPEAVGREEDVALGTYVNWNDRVHLAAAYRGLAQYNMHEGICNHLTLITRARSGKGNVMLLVPHGLHWTQVKASTLLGLDDENNVVEGNGWPETAARTIHRPIHDARPDAKAVFHLHPPYATSLLCLKDAKLEMCHQNSLRFYRDVAYDSGYEGFSEDFDEGQRLVSILKNNNILMMANHGILVCGTTVAEAFDAAYYLERAAMYQVIAMQTGRPLRNIDEINPTVAEYTFKLGKETLPPYYEHHLSGIIEILRQESPGFDN